MNTFYCYFFLLKSGLYWQWVWIKRRSYHSLIITIRFSPIFKHISKTKLKNITLKYSPCIHHWLLLWTIVLFVLIMIVISLLVELAIFCFLFLKKNLIQFLCVHNFWSLEMFFGLLSDITLFAVIVPLISSQFFWSASNYQFNRMVK